ncbi:hypothetical protein J6590_097221 [Homalodisca vitripennis]|nr:hypothetical protein J6590_097221 [Homalodisca vitripennis]
MVLCETESNHIAMHFTVTSESPLLQAGGLIARTRQFSGHPSKQQPRWTMFGFVYRDIRTS